MRAVLPLFTNKERVHQLYSTYFLPSWPSIVLFLNLLPSSVLFWSGLGLGSFFFRKEDPRGIRLIRVELSLFRAT
uniref:Uncharacterized protein n=1 Tax=Picea glauca TaxID=3330 RepID=A0A101LW29_PICGL|nr:hypothetical protein ABT39_MTgene1523 [Picea glauca]QHR88240.1 hypothetical protein Q903MT_gene2253 [Picea sitchensis]